MKSAKSLTRESILKKEQYFLDNIAYEPMSGCWLWVGSCSHGYGTLSIDGNNVRAHRYSFALHHKDIPIGACVLHKCDNPPCVNPQHLFLGSQQDNVKDFYSKSRFPLEKVSCENSVNAKMTNENVLEICKKYNGGKHQVAELSKRYGVSKQAIRAMLSGRTWSIITGRGK